MRKIKLQKIVGNLLDRLRKLYMNGTVTLEIFSLPQDRFVTECFNRRSLTISQALCLLWHNQDSGEVPGRKSSSPLYGNVTAAALVDLYVLRKIDFEDVPVTCLGVKYKSMSVKVNSRSQ